MTDHLPECSESMIPDFHNERWICICDRLRACEQRIKQSITGLSWYSKARWTGYYEGVEAAEAAVAEQKLIPLAKQGRFIITRNTKLWDQRQAWSELGWWDFRKSALSAIRALKEKP